MYTHRVFVLLRTQTTFFVFFGYTIRSNLKTHKELNICTSVVLAATKTYFHFPLLKSQKIVKSGPLQILQKSKVMSSNVFVQAIFWNS